MRPTIVFLIIVLFLISLGLYFYLGKQPEDKPGTVDTTGEQAIPELASGRITDPDQKAAEPSPTDKAGAEPSAPQPVEGLDEEAKEYIREITEPKEIRVDKADNFVRKDQVLSLIPDTSIEVMTPQQIIDDPQVSENTPLTVIREVEQVEVVTPEKLMRDSGIDPDLPLQVMDGQEIKAVPMGKILQRYLEEPQSPVTIVIDEGETVSTTYQEIIEQSGMDLDRPVQVLKDDDVEESSVGELLEQYSGDKTPFTIVRKTEQIEIVTAGELQQDESLASDQTVKVVRQPYTLESTTVSELLMGETGVDDDSIFYVKTITDADQQGLWGIVHSSLIENFATGIALRRGEDITTYQVDIPRDADEMLDHHTSSFLGRMIHQKTRDSYVYNFTLGQMGRSPDLLYPGQEIVIIRFPKDELVRIYKYFVNQQGTDSSDS